MGAAVPGPLLLMCALLSVWLCARLKQLLVTCWAVLYVLWRFGYVLIEVRAMMCGVVCGSVALFIASVVCVCSACVWSFLRLALARSWVHFRVRRSLWAFWMCLIYVLKGRKVALQ